MKKYRRILTVLLAFFAFASMAKAQKTYYFYDEGRVIYQIPFADVDSITLDPIVELAVDNITLFNVNDSCRLDLKVEPEGVIEYSDIKWTSADENVALIRNGYIIPKSEGETVINGTYEGRLVSCSVKVVKPIETVNIVPENPDQFVDLGLPSGTLWAKCNLGVSRPEETGDFYAWGELEPKKEFTFKNYKWLNKYGTELDVSKIQNNNTLYPVFDVCTHKLGEEFGLPNFAQINELVKCTSRWDTLNGKNGLFVIGPNGNSIFLPAAYKPGEIILEVDYLSSYAKKNLYASETRQTLCSPGNNVYDACLVRPVYRKKEVKEISLSKNKIELCLGSSPTSLRLVPANEHLGESDLLWHSSNNEVATVKDGIVTPVSAGHCVVACSYQDLLSYCEVVVTDSKDTTPIITHEYVDLGLPSGNLWATTNIGASTPESFGDFFTWGNVTPCDEIAYHSCGNMWWGVSIDELMDRNVITPDTVLSHLYDAAKYNWGGEWSVPTKSDFVELLDNCDVDYTSINNTNVARFIGPNGNELIIPNAGLIQESSIYKAGVYWSSTPCDDGNSFLLHTWDRNPYNEKVNDVLIGKRGSLFRIRPVMKPNNK